LRGLSAVQRFNEPALSSPFSNKGACLLLACLSGEWLVVANVGDSRAVLGSYSLGSTHQLTSRYH
jgi:serine/threonine protein phosphatase PrpC